MRLSAACGGVVWYASAGLQVQSEGNAAVVEALTEKGVLLKEEQYAHKYPYDWRTKKPTIFRATSQWFASVEGFRWGERGGAGAWCCVCVGKQHVRNACVDGDCTGVSERIEDTLTSLHPLPPAGPRLLRRSVRSAGCRLLARTASRP